MTIKGINLESNDKYKVRKRVKVPGHHGAFSTNIFVLSAIFNPKAKTIFRFVSGLHDIPFSIRVMVSGEILALLESSALLIIKDSLIFLRLFLLICFDSALRGCLVLSIQCLII